MEICSTTCIINASGKTLTFYLFRNRISGIVFSYLWTLDFSFCKLRQHMVSVQVWTMQKNNFTVQCIHDNKEPLNHCTIFSAFDFISMVLHNSLQQQGSILQNLELARWQTSGAKYIHTHYWIRHPNPQKWQIGWGRWATI